MPSNAASSISGPISVSGSRGSPTFDPPRTAREAARPAHRRRSRGRSAAAASCSAGPAVPAAENRIARAASSRSALRADDHRIVAAELEQARGRTAARRAGRRRGPSRSSPSPTPARRADRRPALRRCRARPGRAGPGPSGASPNRSSARRTSAITASAHSGVFSLGFQITGSPQTSASAAFHAHTATGKLKALITSTGPSGCHCSIIR